jgi:iron complex transport system substrate-binding protein
MTGEEVLIPKVVNRVLVDWVAGTQMVITLGAKDKLVGVSPWLDSRAPTFAETWTIVLIPGIENVPVEAVAQHSGNTINAEGVLLLKPDLVITDRLTRLTLYKNAGLHAIFANLGTQENYIKSMLMIGDALGDAERKKANLYNDYLNANFAMVKDRIARANLSDADKQQIMYFQAHSSNEADVVYNTIGVGEIQEAWITTAGGILLTTDLKGRVEDGGVSKEYILSKNPELVFIGGQGSTALYNKLMNDADLASLPAVKNKNVVQTPQGLFPWCRTGPEVAIHIVWAGKFLHPTLFEDIDMAAMTKSFYSTFYGANLSDEQISKILSGREYPGAK